ncbi:hypothetical protein M9Y10_001629 [Tritrichomonas musculus]|uniref:Uncharacterized protein n=1 Tax=Tritrichomonas musculus TaxID=1915356 RepID=A0ABR2L8J1_9EUKA
MIFPISFIVVIVLFILLQKPPLNRAFHAVVDIFFAYIPKEHLNKYSHSDKPADKNKVQNLGDIHYIIKKTTQNDCLTLPYMNDFIYLWSMFLAGVFAQFICISLGVIPISSPTSSFASVLSNEVNHFASISLGVILVILKFGITSSFNRRFHRRFAVLYGIFFGILSFFLIRKIHLGIFEFRPILIELLGIPQLFADIIISVAIGIIAYSLSTPMLYELFSYKMIHDTPNYALLFNFAKNFYQNISKYLRFFSNLAYNVTPFTSLLIYLLSRLVVAKNSDLILSVVYVVIQFFIAFTKLYGLKDKSQILTFAALRYIVAFNVARTYDSGKDALAAVNRSLSMLPVSSLSLSIHPMIVIFLSSLFFSSFVMNGIYSMIARHLSIFIIALAEWIIAGYRVFGLFIEGVD